MGKQYKQTLTKQIEYLKSIDLYDLTIQRVLEYDYDLDETCNSIVDFFHWSMTPEKSDFWRKLQDSMVNKTGVFNTSNEKIFHSLFPKRKYPHLYI